MRKTITTPSASFSCSSFWQQRSCPLLRFPAPSSFSLACRLLLLGFCERHRHRGLPSWLDSNASILSSKSASRNGHYPIPCNCFFGKRTLERKDGKREARHGASFSVKTNVPARNMRRLTSAPHAVVQRAHVRSPVCTKLRHRSLFWRRQ